MATTSSPMSDFFSDLNSERITIIAGAESDAKESVVPTGVLCRASKWFENATKADRFIEGRKKEIRMPEEMRVQSRRLCSSPTMRAWPSRRPLSTCSSAASTSTFVSASGLLETNTAWQISRMPQCIELVWSLATRTMTVSLKLPCSPSASKDPRKVRLYAFFSRITYVNLTDTCGADFAIDGEVAGCPAFLAVMHASEAAFHKLPRPDFPRYLKPAKFADLLFVKTDKPKTSDTQWLYYDPSDDGTAYTDCDFVYNDIRPLCKVCSESDALALSETGPCSAAIVAQSKIPD